MRAVFSIVVAMSIMLSTAVAQEWGQYGADKAGTRYSPLSQIDRTNVGNLEVAWTYRTGIKERGGKPASNTVGENTPMIVDGRLITCTPLNRVIALDPASGEELWSFDSEVRLDFDIPLFYVCRGVTAWVDEEADEGALCRQRLFIGTMDSRLLAIDATTGKRCTGFGENGEVPLPVAVDQVFPGEVRVTSPPAVSGGVVAVGSSIFDNMRVQSPSGAVRAFDARSGAPKWSFDPVPRDADDPMASTWGPEGAKVSGHTNVWGVISVDEERDLMFLPTTSPSPDFWGGHRPGENRYANSLVAIRAATGEVAWHFQIVHHDLWDFDTAPQPLLIDLPHRGETVPAVVQNTKQGFVFVLNRETGEPIFPIEERRVPQGTVEGEWHSPTQPFPVKPPPLVKLGLTPEEAWGFTFVDRWACRQTIANLRHDGFYAPPGLRGTVTMPSYVGGANWGGPAYDPERRMMIVRTNRIPAFLRLLSKDARANVEGGEVTLDSAMIFPQEGAPYLLETGFIMSPLGAPCSAPPWGALTAVDLNDGSIKWEVPLGSIERLAPIPLPWELGVPGFGGPMVTGGGLIFIAASMDQEFRAFDIDSGKKLWQASLPAGGHAAPMTYEVDGRQFIVVTAGGHMALQTEPGDYVIAYALNR